ncbi:MAG TPA: hypothetical protein VLI91_10815, partial [Roseiarcus sp.]|nr:hypothetical protein [Roseiarcus sp.]
MNRAMAWNVAGVGRRTRDSAVEAARRAGMRLDDWLDEAIADHAGLDPHATPEDDVAEDDRLDAAAGRLERIARRNGSHDGPRVPGASPLNSLIERLEMRLGRAEAQAARAFESVAHILERDNAARDGDRRALIDAVRRLESIRTSLTGPAQGGAATGEGFAQPPEFNPKAPFDLKAAVSQIAMRRHEIEERAARGEIGAARPDARLAAAAEASAPSPADRSFGAQNLGSEPSVPLSEHGPDAAPLPQASLDDMRTLALKSDEMGRERLPSKASADLGAMRAEIEA